jgi:phosphoribosylglycinamide formyltransferase 1
MKKIAILASGSGSNAENLVRYFDNHPNVEIALMVSDRKNAFVFERMQRLNIPSYYMSKEDFENGNVLKLLEDQKVDWIVLAGFLKLLPAAIIHAYPHRIVNIHPALLPKFGGKGMYGRHVHEAVAAAGESKTGITIHYVNENFDEGEIISQYETPVSATDTPETIASKIHDLEMNWFPKVIEKVVLG